MDKQRIEIYKQFAEYLEYPMAVFEAETGKILEINHEAEEILGKSVKEIHIEPGRSLVKDNFWELLHGKKSLMWHRMSLKTDVKEYLICGLVNETVVEGKLIYTLLFELRSGISFGNLTLERIVEHAGMVAIHMTKKEEGFQIEYVTKNVSQCGYTRAQLYQRIVTITDLICTEDLKRVQESVANAAEKHMNEDTIECRMVTEARELIPVRLLVHYLYDGDEMTDIEILLIDLREEIRRNSENAYLSNAISKMKSVVFVKSYRAGKRVLKYISPNAGMLGMNVDALKKGYKLTEDYIHPEDRDSVIDSVYQAVANEIGDYVQTYRLVRDDGKRIWIESEVTVNRVSDGEAEVSFLLTDITEWKNMEKELAVSAETGGKPVKMDTGSSDSLLKRDKKDTEMLKQLQLMVETLGQDAGYYSVVLSAEGEILTAPAGPVNCIGQFYDLFERPQFKEQFKQITVRIKKEPVPQSVSFAIEQMEVHMVFAPVMMENDVTAYWVLTSFEQNGAEIIGAVITKQWYFANSIAKSFYVQEAVQNEIKLRKLAEMQLDKEQKELRAVQDMVVSMLREGEGALGEICYKAGLHLSVSHIGLYLENKETKSAEKYFVWDRAGDDSFFFDDMELSVSEYQKLKEYFKDQQVLVIDKGTEDLFLRERFQKTEMETIMMFALTSSSGMQGYIVLADAVRPHKFEEKDIHFAACITHMFESIMLHSEATVKADVTKGGFFEVYDHIQDAIFVKDDKSGDIIFANKAMDMLFGYSLVGMQAKDVVYDQLEQYRNMHGMRKRFIANKKVTKWQSYMKELDQIMNIVEIHMEMLTGKEYSLFILKKTR